MGTLANSEGPYKMPHNATFYQSLHCLLRRNRWKSLNALYAMDPPDLTVPIFMEIVHWSTKGLKAC